MTMPGAKAGKLIPQQLRREPNTVARANSLGDFQFAVLCAVHALSPRATLNGAIEYIYAETGDVMDVAQTYGALERLAAPGTAFVKKRGKETMEKGGRPSTLFAITKAGQVAIEEKTKHMTALFGLARKAERAAAKNSGGDSMAETA